eukprot:jgi/Orpsp1_1/1192670/evm.model.d7180000095108.1
MVSKFPNNYDELLLEAVKIDNNEQNDINYEVLIKNNKSNIYQNNTHLVLNKKSHSIKKENCKNMLSINKIVNNNINKNELSNYKKINGNLKTNELNNIPLKCSESIIIDNNNKIINNNKFNNKEDQCKTQNSDNNNNNDNNDNNDNKSNLIENNEKSINNINIHVNDVVSNSNKNANKENDSTKRNNKRIKMDHPKKGIDIEFPIIRNPNYNYINDKDKLSNDNLKSKEYQKKLLFKNIKTFNENLINEKVMDEFLKFSKQNENYTNNLSVIDKVVLDDITKEFISKNSNEISNSELMDANGNSNNNNNNNNRNLRSRLNNNSNGNRNFNNNFSQFSRNVDNNLSNFENNNNNNENNKREDNNKMNEEGESSNTGKVKITNKEIRKIRCALRRAVMDCSERGLFQASK